MTIECPLVLPFSQSTHVNRHRSFPKVCSGLIHVKPKLLQLIGLFSFSCGSSSTACVLTQALVACPHPCFRKHNVSICLWVKSCVLNPHKSIDERYSRNCVLNPHILGPNCFTSGGTIQIAGLQHVKFNVQIYVSQRSTLVIT